MRTIAIAGHICVDIRPVLPDTVGFEPGHLVEIGAAEISLGGSVGNTGRRLASLGADISVFSSIGDDELGQLVQSELEANERITPRLRVVPGASTSYSLILEPGAADRTIWHHVGANATFNGSGLDLVGVDLFHLGYPPLLPATLVNDAEPLRSLLETARLAGITTSVDLAVVDPASPVAMLDWERILSRMLPHTDIVSPSLDDLRSALGIDAPYSPELVEDLAGRLISWGAAVAAVSAGRHGVHIKTAPAHRFARAGRALARLADSWADRSITVPAVPVEVHATTNGAGDASTAGLVFAIASGAGLADAATLSTVCAAAVVSGRRVTPEVITAIHPELARVFAHTAVPRDVAPALT